MSDKIKNYGILAIEPRLPKSRNFLLPAKTKIK